MATMADYLREMQLRAARGWTPGVPTRYTGALSTSYAPFSNLGALYSAAQPKPNIGDIAAASNPAVEKKPTVGRPRLTAEQIQRTASRLGQGTVKALPAFGAAYEMLRSEPAVASELAPGINPTDFRVTQAYPSMAVDDPTTPVVETYPNVSTLPSFDITPDAGGAVGGPPGGADKYGPSGYEGERIPPEGFRQIAPDTVIASQPNWDTMENMYAQLGGDFPADTEVQGFWDKVAQGNIINELTKSAGVFNEGSVASKALEPFFGGLPEYRTRSDAIEKMANMGLVSGLEADAWKGWDLGKSLQEDAIGQVVGAAVTAGTAIPYQIGDELFGYPADSGRNIGLQTPVVDALSQGWKGAKSGLANIKGLVQAYTNPDVMPVERLSAFADMLQQGIISPEYAIDQTPEMMRLDKYGVEEFSDFAVQENLRKAEELATPVVAPAVDARTKAMVDQDVAIAMDNLMESPPEYIDPSFTASIQETVPLPPAAPAVPYMDQKTGEGLTRRQVMAEKAASASARRVQAAAEQAAEAAEVQASIDRAIQRASMGQIDLTTREHPGIGGDVRQVSGVSPSMGADYSAGLDLEAVRRAQAASALAQMQASMGVNPADVAAERAIGSAGMGGQVAGFHPGMG